MDLKISETISSASSRGGEMVNVERVFPIVQKAVKTAFPQATDQAIMAKIQDFAKKHPKVDDKLFAGVFLKAMQQPKVSNLMPQAAPKPTGLQNYLGVK